MVSLMDSQGWLHTKNRAAAAVADELNKMATGTPTIEALKERQGFIRGVRMAMEIPETLRKEVMGRRAKG